MLIFLSLRQSRATVVVSLRILLYIILGLLFNTIPYLVMGFFFKLLLFVLQSMVVCLEVILGLLSKQYVLCWQVCPSTVVCKGKFRV